MDRSNEGIARRMLADRISKISGSLSELAESVEAYTGHLDKVGQPGRPSYAAVAQSVQHEVLWALANLHLDGLTADAQLADWARDEATVRAKVAEEIAADVEATVGGYPGNGAARPKVERGQLVNDAEWAARIAREHGKES